MRAGAETAALTAAALLATLVLFGGFVALHGVDPLAVYATLFVGAFGTRFSLEDTLTQAAPLMLTALCTAIPARAGLLVIGGEGALVVGGVHDAHAPLPQPTRDAVAADGLRLRRARGMGGPGHRVSSGRFGLVRMHGCADTPASGSRRLASRSGWWREPQRASRGRYNSESLSPRYATSASRFTFRVGVTRPG